MTVRVGMVGVMRMVVSVGIREWTRPSRQHNVTVGPAVRVAMDMPSMPMKDSARTGHACLTLARHDGQTVWLCAYLSVGLLVGLGANACSAGGGPTRSSRF
jgi:hypothetical protein